MALFLAVGVGLVTWPLVSSTYPNLLSPIPFDGTSYAHLHKGNLITPQLLMIIEKTLALENISRLSVAVVPKDGEPEFHTWGCRTEDRDQAVAPGVPRTPPPPTRFCSTRDAALTLYRCQWTFFYPHGVGVQGVLRNGPGLLIVNGNNVIALPFGLTELTWHTRLRDLLPDW